MRKLFLLMCSILECVSVFSNDSLVSKIVERINGVLYVVENGEKYVVDKKIVTVRLKAPNYQTHKGAKVLYSPKLNFADIEVPDTTDVEDYVKELQSLYIYDTVEYNVYGKYTYNPNDSNSIYQWYLNTINMYDAWNITTGSPLIKVAVIDSGVDTSHCDIGCGFDDYSNIDLSNGWNYVTECNSVITSNPHGTCVAGIIGAKTGNQRGIAGISGGDGSSGITIIPYCVGVATPNSAYVYNAIIDAVNKGVKVINLSLNISSNSAINAAIDYAYNNGVSVVCSSGNDFSSTISYPASHEKTIAVGAVNSESEHAPFSNYGYGLDITAPGTMIYSTINDNGYDFFLNGTSFSAPQVTGCVALMLSLNPTLTPNQIKGILHDTCIKLPEYTYTNGWNEKVGYGLLNAYAAVIASFHIVGSNGLYNSSSYYIQNLPTNYNVIWTLIGDNASNFTLQSDTSTNQCILTRKEDVEFSGSSALTLSAQILCSGTPIITKTKSICAPYISGDSNPCLNELYSVEGYSTGEYVTWNLSGSGYSVIPDLVPTNTEGNNYLGVHRTASSQTYASGTITATISSGGNVLGTLTKKISSAAGFSGTWYQSSSLFPPYTPDDTPEELECGLHTFSSGKRIIMQSDDFIGATISGNAVISHNNSIVSFPTFSGTSFTINGYVSGTCKAYQFRFLAAVDPILPLDLSINSTGSGYVFSLSEKQQGDRSEENQSKTPYSGQWQLTIMQSETGQTMYNGTTDGQSITVNTSGWRRGLYVAVARVNDSTIAQKLAIEE